MADRRPSDEASVSASRDVILEHYRHLRERYARQGDRLWLRFYYFLTIEAVLFGTFVKVKETSSLRGLRLLVLLLGTVWTALWFVIAAQDLWFFEQARKRLNDFTQNYIVPRINPSWDYWTDYPTGGLKKLICFKIPKCGVTSFSVICTLFVGFMWALLWWF